MAFPKLVIILCGKRKSGKDFVAARLEELLKDSLSLVRLSKPLKEQFAKDHGLDHDRLMDSSSYKEIYRQQMIVWGEEIRDRDPAYFCQLATKEAIKPVWLIVDARRPSDMNYFKSEYMGHTLTVRVVACEDVRAVRGWVFTEGVDDAPSECALDTYPVDMVINNNTAEELETQLEAIRTRVQLIL